MDSEQSTDNSRQLTVESQLLQVTSYKLRGVEEAQAASFRSQANNKYDHERNIAILREGHRPSPTRMVRFFERLFLLSYQSKAEIQRLFARWQMDKPFRVMSFRLQVGPVSERNLCLSAVGRRGKSAVWVLVLLAIGMLLMGACSNNTVTLATYTPPAVQPKILATVYISPTPNAEQQQALAAANPPTATPMVIPTVTATPYVGVFLGEVDSGQDGGAVIPPALLGGATSSVPVTLALGPACPAQADVAFGTRWSENADLANALGCPIEGAGNLQGTYQIFERGVMYYSPSGEIWAIAPAQSHYWYALNAPPVPQGDITVPEGMLAPAQGFGAVWRGLPGVQDALGFARTPEQGSKLVTQKFQNGLLLADGQSGQVFVLLSDGRAMGPY